MDALKGIGYLLKTPRLWPLALVPWFIAFLLYVVLGWLGWRFWATDFEDWAQALALVAYVVVFPFAFYLLGSSFLGLVFDPLSRETERLLDGAAVALCPLKPLQILGDTCKRLLLNGSICVLAFALGPVLGSVAGILGTGLISLLDYTSPAFLRRGTTLGSQARLLLRNPDIHTLSFALVAGLLSLMPFIGLFLAPGLIVGGTLLARRRLQ